MKRDSTAWHYSALRFLTSLLAALAPVLAQAAPGAHGPSGEHLDEKATASGGVTAPRLEAKSETFELVAVLAGGELSILIDRYETNEPVLGAQLEVQSGNLKASAKFHSDHGDYAVDDPAFLKALAAPGEHALVFTLRAGQESDLLEGTLSVKAAASAIGGRAHSHLAERVAITLSIAGIGLLAALIWWHKRLQASDSRRKKPAQVRV